MKAAAAWKIGYLAISNYAYMMMGGTVYRTLKALFDDDEEWVDAMNDYFSLENQWKLFLGSIVTLGMGRTPTWLG